MRITLLLLALFTALTPRWEPSRISTLASPCDSKLESLRRELGGVQMELMDVMRTNPAASARLRGREEELKYRLRAEQIRLQDSVQCPPSELALRCVSSAETPRS